jgi:hypothetical protein
MRMFIILTIAILTMTLNAYADCNTGVVETKFSEILKKEFLEDSTSDEEVHLINTFLSVTRTKSGFIATATYQTQGYLWSIEENKELSIMKLRYDKNCQLAGKISLERLSPVKLSR